MNKILFGEKNADVAKLFKIIGDNYYNLEDFKTALEFH